MAAIKARRDAFVKLLDGAVEASRLDRDREFIFSKQVEENF